MATRRSEWLASIKPILDRDEAKKDAAALAKELGDILEIKFDASTDNLDELVKEFNAQLKTMGKQPIVFSEKTLRGIVSQFTNAIAQGISGGIEESMKRLRAEREQIIGEQKALEARKQKLKGARDFAYDLSYSKENKARAFNLDEVETIKKAASDMGQNFDNFVLEMKSNVEKLQIKLSKLKFGTPEFDTTIKDFYEQTHDLFRMSRTLSKHPDLVVDKDIIEEFSFDNLKYMFAEDIDENVAAFEQSINKVYKTLGGFTDRLKDIDVELQKIQSNRGNIIDEDKARNGLKTLDEIKAKYQELSKERAFQSKQKITSFVDYEPKQAKNKVGLADGIKTFSENYKSAASSGDWVEEYGALVKYVRLYESYLQMGSDAQRKKITEKNNPYTKLYNQLKPMAENAENMLRNVVNMMDGAQLVGMGDVKTDEVASTISGPTQEDVANAQKLREEAEAKAKAEAGALELAKQKRIEEEKADEAAERKKQSEASANDWMSKWTDLSRYREAAAQAAREELEDAKQTTAELEKQNKLLLYRRVEGDFDPNRISGRSIDALYNKKNEPIIQSALEFGFGGFGDGLYSTTLGGAEDLALDASAKTSFIEFDASGYNFYINKTVEQAEDLRVFLLSLQKLVGANTLLDTSKLTDIADLSEDQLFERAQSIFENFGMSKAQFYTWIENAQKEAKSIADLFSKGEVPADRHNFGTRFMKTLGYQGVLNDTGDDDYDGNYHGSVIYDPDADNIKASMTVFKSTDEYLDHIRATAQSAGQAVDALNDSLEKTEQLTSSGGTGSGVGDASLTDLEAERAKAEALQDELDNRLGALQAAHDENDALQERLQKQADEAADAARRNQEARAELYEQISNAEAEAAAAKERANAAEAEADRIRKESNAPDSSADLISLRTQLEDEHQMRVATENALSDVIAEKMDAESRASEAEAKVALLEKGTVDSDGKNVAINAEELKNVLNAITYSVKIAYDDSDKTANKIALDDSTLEATLTKVFANVLKPDVPQDSAVQNQEHWALESTLQTVKGVLDNIHNNTIKIGAGNTPNIGSIDGTTLDSRLIEIKSVLESINGQIVKGGVITTRGAVKQAAAQPTESEVKLQAARSNAMKSLINDYKTMGKLSAQFDSDKNLETKAMLDNLKKEIARKRQSLKVTMDENKNLREKYSIAFDAEKRLLDAAKAQAEIDQKNKQDDRNNKAAWKKQIKDAQRATGINAATTAANAGDQTVVRAIGTNGISKDIENKAKELSEQIKALRVLRDQIDKDGDKASEQDKDVLTKRIAKVKELKTELDSYLKIHEKYSGDGVSDLGDASNFGAVGTDQYWNNITAAIQNVTAGKTTIKGLNADTGELTGTTKIAANTFAEWSAVVDPLTGRLSMLRTGIKKTETIIEQIKRKTKEIFTYFSGSSLIFKAVNEIKKGVQYIRDIDLALTELKKVTDETEETYRKFLDTASKTAAKVGSTIKDVVSSTADWARLGSVLAKTSISPII